MDTSRLKVAWTGAVALVTDDAAHPRLSLAVQMALGLAVFVVVAPLAFACGRLPESIYHRPVVIVAALAHAAPLALALSSLAAVSVLHRRLRWREIGLGSIMRWFALANCLTLAWAFSTGEYNYWVDRPHDVDRLLLFVLPWLVLWHPGFLGVFLAQAHIMAGQFNEPLVFSWTDKLLIYEVLMLLYVFVGMTLLNPRQGLLPFLGAAACLVALHYAVPAGGKLWLGWLARNDGANILLSAWHQNGWLDGLGAAGRGRAIKAVESAGLALKVFTLVLELGVVVMLRHRLLAMALLLGCVAMHVGILMTTGICFWKWIVLDVSLAAVVMMLPADDARRLFGPAAALTGAALVAGLFVTHRRPPVLAWDDAPMSFQFRIEAEGASGTRYEVTPAALAPFDLPFAQARFYFLTDLPMIVDCLGSIFRRDLLAAVEQARTPEDVAAIRAALGPRRVDTWRAGRLQALLERRFQHHERPRAVSWMSRLPRPPQHIWTGPHRGEGLDEYRGQEPIRSVRVRLREAMQHDRQVRVIGERVVLAFDVAGPEAVTATAAEAQ